MRRKNLIIMFMNIVLYKRYEPKEELTKEEFLDKYVTILPLSYVKGCQLVDKQGKICWVTNDYKDLYKQIMKKERFAYNA